MDKALQTVESDLQATTAPAAAEEDDLTISELQQQLEAIQSEMEKRTERAEKYKRLYYEERKRSEELATQVQVKIQVCICSPLYHLGSVALCIIPRTTSHI